MKAEAIKDIKMKLAKLSDSDAPYLKILADDERMGVQNYCNNFIAVWKKSKH